MNKELQEKLVSEGYLFTREVPYWGVCGVMKYMYTWGVCFNMDDLFIGGRFCFDEIGAALQFYGKWDGLSIPVVGRNHCTSIKGHHSPMFEYLLTGAAEVDDNGKIQFLKKGI